jgi:hypothetical protein
MIPPSLGAFFSQSQSGTSQSQSGTFDTPPPAQPTAEENHPTAFLEPTRDNAIELRKRGGPPRLRRSNTGRVDVLESSDGSPLPQTATPEESESLTINQKLMLFLWHNADFAGFYTEQSCPTTPTNSERFYMMREFMLVRYRATKSHFLFRYAYVSHLTYLLLKAKGHLLM